jgi:site-specific DNA recombinase
MRVSSEEQKQRQTITTQHEQIERYSLKHEIAVADYYADDGISGTIPIDQRPEGRRLIADARAGRIKRKLLVYKLDRLGRDALVTLSAIDALDQCGVEIVSITQNLDLKTPHGKFHGRDRLRRERLRARHDCRAVGRWAAARRRGRRMARR